MCLPSPKPPSPPPAPEPKPDIKFSGATTKQNAPTDGRGLDIASSASRRKSGRGSLRIPLASSGLTKSGLNLPSA
tara:strand:- start:1572 stop:1796 length:225 start_codon:yes stop_codon:yes gene_type:complete